MLVFKYLANTGANKHSNFSSNSLRKYSTKHKCLNVQNGRVDGTSPQWTNSGLFKVSKVSEK